MIKVDKNSLYLMPKLLDEICDRYFRFDAIVFSKDSGELKLFLGEKKRWFFGEVIISKVLKITGVTHSSCIDTERIGQNSIKQVHIDLDKGTIDIECHAPAEMKHSITPDFEISVEKKESK